MTSEQSLYTFLGSLSFRVTNSLHLKRFVPVKKEKRCCVKNWKQLLGDLEAKCIETHKPQNNCSMKQHVWSVAFPWLYPTVSLVLFIAMSLLCWNKSCALWIVRQILMFYLWKWLFSYHFCLQVYVKGLTSVSSSSSSNPELSGPQAGQDASLLSHPDAGGQRQGRHYFSVALQLREWPGSRITNYESWIMNHKYVFLWLTGNLLYFTLWYEVVPTDMSLLFYLFSKDLDSNIQGWIKKQRGKGSSKLILTSPLHYSVLSSHISFWKVPIHAILWRSDK